MLSPVIGHRPELTKSTEGGSADKWKSQKESRFSWFHFTRSLVHHYLDLLSPRPTGFAYLGISSLIRLGCLTGQLIGIFENVQVGWNFRSH